MVIDKDRYIKAYSSVFDISEDEIRDFLKARDISDLITNANTLFSSDEQRKKYEAFMQLYSMSEAVTMDKMSITSVSDLNKVARHHMKDIFDKEAVCLIMVNSQHDVIDANILSTGNIDSSIVDVREIFKAAILNKASAIFLVHNHPSGKLEPSNADINITKRVQEAGRVMGVVLLDHLIISGYDKDNYYSFAEKGYIIASDKVSSVRENEGAFSFSTDNMKIGEIKMENKERNYAYINVHKSFAKQMESKIEGKEHFNVMRLPNGVIVADKDLSGGIINPNLMYENKFNKNLVTAQYNKDYLEDNAITVNMPVKEGGYEKIRVDIDVLSDAVDIANKRYMESKREEIVKENIEQKKEKELSFEEKKEHIYTL